jgi:hypothetical protein
MALLKQEYRDDLEKARLTGLSSGSDFFYTALVPGNVGRAAGWTEFTFSSGDFQSQAASSYSTRRWQASGGGGFLGIFGGGGGGGGSSSREESHHKFSLDRFYLRFEIAQVPIVRPWFKQGFLLSKSWRFDQNNPEAKGEIVSDAGTPPKGLIPAYPTTAIFVRNLHMFLGHSEGFSDWMTQHTSSRAGGGGFVNFGPFHIGGSYSRASSSGMTEHNRGNSWDNEGLHIDGMQVVGFKCHILPKSPNPLPDITAWI